MAIRDIVTAGFGNGTFNGTIALVVVRGYAEAAAGGTRRQRAIPALSRRKRRGKRC